MISPSRRKTTTAGAWVLLLAFVASQLAGWAHFALVPHSVCAVDGLAAHGSSAHGHAHAAHGEAELTLVPHAHGAAVEAVAGVAVPDGPAVSPERQDHAEHCVLAQLRSERPTLQVDPTPGVARLAPRARDALPIERVEGPAWALYRLAPKNSPPQGGVARA